MFYYFYTSVLLFVFLTFSSVHAVHFSKLEKEPGSESYPQALQKFKSEKDLEEKSKAFHNLLRFDPKFEDSPEFEKAARHYIEDLEQAKHYETAMLVFAELLNRGESRIDNFLKLLELSLPEEGKGKVKNYLTALDLKNKEKLIDPAHQLLTKVHKWEPVTDIIIKYTDNMLQNKVSLKVQHDFLKNAYMSYPSVNLAKYYLEEHIWPEVKKGREIYLQKAIELTEKVMAAPELDSDNLHLFYIHCLEKSKKYDQLESFAENESKENPGSISAWIALANGFVRKDEYEKAASSLTNLANLARGKFKRNVLFNLAYCLEKDGQSDKSQKILIQVHEDALKRQQELAKKRASERKSLTQEIMRAQQTKDSTLSEKISKPDSKKIRSLPPVTPYETSTVTENFEPEQTNLVGFYRENSKNKKEKVKTRKGNNNGQQPPTHQEEKEEEKELRTHHLDIIDLLGSTGPAYKTFHRMFDLYRLGGGKRVNDITFDEIEILLEKLHAEPKVDSKHKKAVEKDQGNGSHTKATLNRGRALDENSPEEMVIVTKKNGAHVHPQAIEELAYLFVKYRLYPQDLEDRLKEKWPELFNGQM